MANKKRSFKNSFWYTLIMLFVFSFIVPLIIQIPISFLNIIPSSPQNEFDYITLEYLLFPGITLVSFIILFSLKENKYLRDVLLLKNNKIISGLLLGFLLCSSRVLIAYLLGNIKLALNDYSFFMLFYSLLCIFIAAVSEEYVFRGYIFNKTLKDYKNPMFAIMFNSIIFGLLHIFNDGASVLTILGTFLVGVMWSLFTYYSGTIWEAIAFHTMWNYTQTFIYGLPNSGNVSIYSIFKVVDSSSGIAYNKVYGLEGTIIGVIIDIIVIVIIQLIHRKKLGGKNGRQKIR